MKPTAFLALPLGKEFDELMAKRYTVITNPSERASAKALITLGAFQTDAALMDTMPELGLIVCFGSGYEGVDVAAATKRGIKVANSVGANATSVADHAVALLLASIRQIATGDRLIRAGGWRGEDASSLIFYRGLPGRRIGVLGLGAIGEKIAERVAAFETEVGYFSRRQRTDVPWQYFGSLLELATWADVLMVAHRADETNRHMVNAQIIEALGPDGHIVNISRGSAVDEDALIAALKSRKIAGAGLDVFEDEPKVRPELAALPNVVLTPHVGGGTREAFSAMTQAVVANVDAFFNGEPLPHPVI
jgi:glyoxylate reductase